MLIGEEEEDQGAIAATNVSVGPTILRVSVGLH